MRRRLPIALLFAIASVLTLQAACSDDEGGAVSPVNNDTSNNTTNNTTGNNDTSNNDDPVNNDDPGCATDADCAEGRRCISDGRCLTRWNRACVVDEDCRVAETCQDVGGALACVRDDDPILACPGSPGCESAEGTFEAGFGAKTITPPGFEQPLREFMDGAIFAGDPDIIDGDVTFIDCGLDQLCEGDPGYPGPDFGENDGHMQGAWIAGYDHSRPAFRYCEGSPDGLCPEDQPWLGELAHDDIWARAVAFRRGETTIAIVVVDTVGFFFNHTARIRDKMQRAADVDWIIIASTHVHEAPDALGQWGPGFAGSDLPVNTGAEPWWLDHIDTRAAEALDQALDNLQPARVQPAAGSTGVTDMAIGDGRDPWIVDDDLLVLRFIGQDDQTLGTIVNWGNHPEVLGSDNQFITADYPGYFRDYLEKGLDEVSVDGGVVSPAVEGLGGVSVFLSGALGGLIGPGRHPVVDRAGDTITAQTYDKSDALGQQLTARALQWLESAPTVDEPPLAFAAQSFLMPMANTQFHTAIFGLELFDREVYNVTTDLGGAFTDANIPHVYTAATIVKLGPVTLFTAPGELFPETAIGGFDPVVDSLFTPVSGDPFSAECGSDLLPISCTTVSDCPDNFTCDPGSNNCRAKPLSCGTCPDGFACEEGRCRRPCADDTNACGPGFTCDGTSCSYDPFAVAAEGVARPCLVSPTNPNPPNIADAPERPFLKEKMPGSYVAVIGLGHDELGYMVPTYDFKLAEDGAYIIEAPGDHYEETNSIGPDHMPIYRQKIDALLEALP